MHLPAALDDTDTEEDDPLVEGDEEGPSLDDGISEDGASRTSMSRH